MKAHYLRVSTLLALLPIDIDKPPSDLVRIHGEVEVLEVSAAYAGNILDSTSVFQASALPLISCTNSWTY